MSHSEPERGNRQPEGDMPDEPFPMINCSAYMNKTPDAKIETLAPRHAEPLLCRSGIHVSSIGSSFWERDKLSPFGERIPTIHWQSKICARCGKTLKWKATVSPVS